jgi:hypothetical protein
MGTYGLAVGAFVVQFIIVVAAVTVGIVYIQHRNWYPISHRKPGLAFITLVAASIDFLIYSASVLYSNELSCWSDLISGLTQMLFYFTILLQSVVLWFNDRVTRERFRQVQAKANPDGKVSWFIAHKGFVRDENLYLFLFGFIGIPWIVMAFIYILGYSEPNGTFVNTYDRQTYLNRCGSNYTSPSMVVEVVIASTMVLQLIMLVLSRNISESMMLKREVQIATLSSIIMGFSSVLWDGIHSHVGMQVSFALFLIAFTLGSIVAPLKAAVEFRKARKTMMDPPTTLVIDTARAESDAEKKPLAPATPKSQSSSNSKHYKNYITMIKEKLNDDENLYSGFKRHLMTEFALENIIFLEASTNFMMSPSPPALNDLYVQFIAVRADHEINVAHSLRNAVQNKLEAFADTPQKSLQNEEMLFEKELMDGIYKMQQETYDMLTGGPYIRYKLHLINTIGFTSKRSSSVPLKSPSHSAGATTTAA